MMRSLPGWALFYGLLAAAPARAQHTFLPLSSAPPPHPVFDSTRLEVEVSGGYARATGKGLNASGAGMSWAVRSKMGERWAVGFGSEAVPLGGRSDAAQGSVRFGGAAVHSRGWVERRIPAGSGRSLAFFAGLSLPFSITHYDIRFDFTDLATGKKSSLTPDTAVSLAAGFPIGVQAGYVLGDSWSAACSATLTPYPGGVTFLGYSFLGPLTPARSERIGRFLTMGLGAEAMYRPWDLGLELHYQRATGTGRNRASHGLLALLSWRWRRAS